MKITNIITTSDGQRFRIELEKHLKLGHEIISLFPLKTYHEKVGRSIDSASTEEVYSAVVVFEVRV